MYHVFFFREFYIYICFVITKRDFERIHVGGSSRPVFRSPTPPPLLLLLLYPFPKALQYVFGGQTTFPLSQPKEVACDLVPAAATATPVVVVPNVPAGKGQCLHPRESTVALAQRSGKGRSFPPQYRGRETYVELLDQMGSRFDRGNVVPALPSTATASSSASVSVGTTTPLLTLALAFFLLFRNATASHLLHPPRTEEGGSIKSQIHQGRVGVGVSGATVVEDFYPGL